MLNSTNNGRQINQSYKLQQKQQQQQRQWVFHYQSSTKADPIDIPKALIIATTTAAADPWVGHHHHQPTSSTASEQLGMLLHADST